MGNLVTYAQGAWIGLVTQQVFLGAVCAHDMDVTYEHKFVMADQKARCRLTPVGKMRPRRMVGKVVKGVQNPAPRHRIVRKGRAIPLSEYRTNLADVADADWGEHFKFGRMQEDDQPPAPLGPPVKANQGRGCGLDESEGTKWMKSRTICLISP